MKGRLVKSHTRVPSEVRPISKKNHKRTLSFNKSQRLDNKAVNSSKNNKTEITYSFSPQSIQEEIVKVISNNGELKECIQNKRKEKYELENELKNLTTKLTSIEQTKNDV